MTISTTFDRLYGRFYFGNLRNTGTLRQVASLPALVFAACIPIWLAVHFSDAFSNFVYRVLNRPWIEFAAKGALGLAFILFYVRFAPYKCTNMMLRPDGNGQWSIHMGMSVSMNPLHYALTPKNMIDDGETLILAAALRHGLDGIVTLESHLYGTPELRCQKMKELRNRFPQLICEEKDGYKDIAAFNAYWLSMLRWCLLTRVNLQRRWSNNPNLIDKSNGRITRAMKVGAIEIRIQSRKQCLSSQLAH